MARLVTIEVVGQGGQYEAMIKRMIDQNKSLYSGAEQGAARAAGAVRIFETSLTGVLGLLGQLGVALSVGAVVKYTKGLINLAGSIQDLSDRTGISARTLTGIRSVLEENGVTLEEFAKGIQRAQKSLGGLD